MECDKRRCTVFSFNLKFYFNLYLFFFCINLIKKYYIVGFACKFYFFDNHIGFLNPIKKCNNTIWKNVFCAVKLEDNFIYNQTSIETSLYANQYKLMSDNEIEKINSTSEDLDDTENANFFKYDKLKVNKTITHSFNQASFISKHFNLIKFLIAIFLTCVILLSFSIFILFEKRKQRRKSNESITLVAFA